MKDVKLIITSILLGLSFFVALKLESQMATGYMGELVLIILGLIFMSGIIFGLWIEAEWAYSFGIIFFAAALANLLWLFFTTKIFLTFAFGLLVNVAGLVISLVSIESETPWEEALETYDVDAKKRK